MTENSSDPSTSSTSDEAADLDLVALFRVQAGQHVVVRDALLPFTVECDEQNCREANSHRDTCRCACQGEGHGVRYRAEAARGAAAMTARIDRAGGVMAQLAAMGGLGDSDDGWWNETPVAVPAQRRELPDFDDPCWD